MLLADTCINLRHNLLCGKAGKRNGLVWALGGTHPATMAFVHVYVSHPISIDKRNMIGTGADTGQTHTTQIRVCYGHCCTNRSLFMGKYGAGPGSRCLGLSNAFFDRLGVVGHAGKENAVKRKDLLEFARGYDSEISDRELRNIYCGLEVCSCNAGIFYPIRASEIREFKFYLLKKVRPMRDRWEMVAMKHQSLMALDQMELF